ncbi:hypothetical protein QTP86_004875 [Hemibagrus guttatus]|nr:hypothetical protein QTP86_004875 [Hemibagrus guttatus]
MSFLRRVAGRSLRDRVRSSVTREELGVEPLLLHIERGQLRWLGHLFRMPPGRLPGEVFRACPTGKRPRGRPRTRWRGYVSRLAWERLGVPPEELEEVSGEREPHSGGLRSPMSLISVKAKHFLQLFRRDPEAFPGQPRDIVSPVCPGSSPGPLPGGGCPEHLPRETSRRHPKQMPEPPHLPPFDVEEQRLYSELLPGDSAPYPISKGAPHHPTEEAHFGRLYPGSYPFGHDPELMTIGESRNVD